MMRYYHIYKFVHSNLFATIAKMFIVSNFLTKKPNFLILS